MKGEKKLVKLDKSFCKNFRFPVLASLTLKKLLFKSGVPFAYRWWSLPPPSLLLFHLFPASTLVASEEVNWMAWCWIRPEAPVVSWDWPWQTITLSPANTAPVSAIFRLQRWMVTGTHSPSEVHLTYSDRQKSHWEKLEYFSTSGKKPNLLNLSASLPPSS